MSSTLAATPNDEYPRAVTPEGRRKSGDDWTAVGVTIGDGASIGARAVCVAPVSVGRWALTGAAAASSDYVYDLVQTYHNEIPRRQ
ncbi:MAG TPA: hypothetical protein VFG35_23155 [Actinoplanes sp.]|nr:hypothetical protein [Actinoplanes sp.]